MSLEVIGLGVSTLDILSLVEAFPSGDEVQRAAAVVVQGGGPVFTAIATAAALGARTAMIDRIGDDWRGTAIMAEYRQAGVGTEFLEVVPGATSSIATILVRRTDGARAIAYCPGTTPELSPADVPADAIATAKLLHVNGRYLDACLHACRIARRAGVRVSFDGGAHRYRPELRPLIALTDICIVALDFAHQHTGHTEIDAMARALLAEGPALVVITDGLRGSWIYPRDGEPFHQTAFPQTDLIDTTGCGDTYHGAFLFGLARNLPLAECATLASKLAAQNCRFLGGRGALATLKEYRAAVMPELR
ncbi:MAG: PfkB family carbohydrate kinase [Propionivibrio sp.]